MLKLEFPVGWGFVQTKISSLEGHRVGIFWYNYFDIHVCLYLNTSFES